jgi:hypothetical protein
MAPCEKVYNWPGNSQAKFPKTLSFQYKFVHDPFELDTPGYLGEVQFQTIILPDIRTNGHFQGFLERVEENIRFKG